MQRRTCFIETILNMLPQRPHPSLLPREKEGDATSGDDSFAPLHVSSVWWFPAAVTISSSPAGEGRDEGQFGDSFDKASRAFGQFTPGIQPWPAQARLSGIQKFPIK
jgi:hypothetical protein